MRAVKFTESKLLIVATLVTTLFATSTFVCGQTRGNSRLAITPNTVNFGSVNVGALDPVTIAVSNFGSSSISISNIAASLPEVTILTSGLPLTLSQGQTAQVTLVFSPDLAETFNGTLAFTQSSGRVSLIRITGAGLAAQTPAPQQPANPQPPTTQPAPQTVTTQTGPAQLVVNSSTLIASNLIFGSTAIGSVASQPLTLSNTGGSDLAIAGISMAGPGFSANGISSGLILAPGASAFLNVTFSPNANFAASGSVTIYTDVAGSATIWLSGVGVDSPALGQAEEQVPQASTSASVTLQWQPSTSSVSGYNIYRASSPGGESGTSPINGPTLVDGNTFIDQSVADGATYYYEVVAVASDNTPSTDSNEAAVLLP